MARKPAPSRTCTTCGRTFRGNGTQRTCSPRCRTLATASRRRRQNAPRNTEAARQALAKVRATQPCCWICGYPVPLDVDHQRHPLGSTLDHLTPLSLGGDPLDPANHGHAHRHCNTARHNRPLTPELRARCRAKVEAIMRGGRVRSSGSGTGQEPPLEPFSLSEVVGSRW